MPAVLDHITNLRITEVREILQPLCGIEKTPQYELKNHWNVLGYITVVRDCITVSIGVEETLKCAELYGRGTGLYNRFNRD